MELRDFGAINFWKEKIKTPAATTYRERRKQEP
jgi:hypothetical protein